MGGTYTRPIGDPFKEIGGVMVTALAYCAIKKYDPITVLDTEIERVLAKPRGELVAGHLAKVKDGTANA